MSDQEQNIRERAHALWEQEGRPDGRDREHWLRAQQELESEARPPASAESDPAAAGLSEAAVAAAVSEPVGKSASRQSAADQSARNTRTREPKTPRAPN